MHRSLIIYICFWHVVLSLLPALVLIDAMNMSVFFMIASLLLFFFSFAVPQTHILWKMWSYNSKTNGALFFFFNSSHFDMCHICYEHDVIVTSTRYWNMHKHTHTLVAQNNVIFSSFNNCDTINDETGMTFIKRLCLQRIQHNGNGKFEHECNDSKQNRWNLWKLH